MISFVKDWRNFELKNKVCYKYLKRNYKKWIYSVFRVFFLLATSYIVLYPLIYMLCKSFIAPNDAIDKSIVWLPRTFSFENYFYAFKAMNYGKTFFTTIRIHILSAIIEMTVCSLVAYGLARYKFKGSSLVFMGVVLTIIVPVQSVSVPLYLNFSDLDFLGVLNAISNIIGKNITLNIIDTGWSFYLPALLGVGIKSGLFIFIFRQFFKSFPKELEEAAAIDGAGPFYTFLRIVVPSSSIAYLCVFIFAIIAYWNDYYLSVMFFKSNYPLAVSLSEIKNNLHFMGGLATTDAIHNVTMTGCLLFILPILLVYLILQKRFIQSIDRIGIVG